MCHHSRRTQEPKTSFVIRRAGGTSTLTASTSVSGHSTADVASSSRCKLMVSVSVCSCSSHFLSLPHKQTQQQQHHHHLHLAESASGSSRAAGQQQMPGCRAYLTDIWCNLHALWVLILAGKLYSQLLFTANRQPMACKESAHVSTDTTVCLGAAADGRRLLASSTDRTRQSCGSAGNQASTLLHWLPQQPKWPAVPSSCSTFVTGCSTQHFGDRRHKQLRWRSFVKRQQAYTAICKEISGGSKDTVVAYGDAKFSSSCCKGNPSTPTVSLRRKLGHCCQVYDTDEFRTSKLCCACKTAMDGMPLPLLGNTHLC